VRLRVCGLECAGLGRFAGGGLRVGCGGVRLRMRMCGWGCGGVRVYQLTNLYIYIYTERESQQQLCAAVIFFYAHTNA
jgi:hypothetical protein